MKTCVATTEGIEAFGRDMRTEAERRGIERAKEVVFVSDNGHGMPQMMEREFPEAHHVTDYKHASDRLKDPGYRRRGWPIASSSIESACGQIGERIEHARMRWTRRRAGAMCQVKAAMMSGDGRWERRRPTPIPALDVPALAYPAQAA